MATYTDRGAGVPAVGGQAKSIASIVAILAAVGSFFFVDNAAARFGLAILAIVCGLVGMMRATSSRVSGGILSIAAIVIAAVGMLAAILDAVGVF